MQRITFINLLGVLGLLISSFTAPALGDLTTTNSNEVTPEKNHLTTQGPDEWTTATVQQPATTGGEQPAATTGGEQPAATTGGEQPAATTGGEQPAVTTGTVQPVATTGGEQPVATTVTVQPEVNTGTNPPAEVTTSVPDKTTATQPPEVTTQPEPETTQQPRISTAGPSEETTVHHSMVPERTTTPAPSNNTETVQPAGTTELPPEVTTESNSTENTTVPEKGSNLSAFGGAAGIAIGVVLALVVVCGVSYYIYITVAGRIPPLPGSKRLEEGEVSPPASPPSVRYRSDTEMARLSNLHNVHEESTEEQGADGGFSRAPRVESADY